MDQEFTHSDDEEEIVDVAEESVPSPADTEEEELSAAPDHAADESESEDGTEEDREHTISSDLIRGHINTIILRSLYDGDKYGYAIIEEIGRKSHNQYQLKQPSLYSALKRLEKEGYITSYWGGTAGGGRRKYFSLTDQGKEIAERNLMEWEYSRTVIDSLISDKEFDFSSPAPSAVDMRVLKQSTSRVPNVELDDEDESDGPEEPAEWTPEDTDNGFDDGADADETLPAACEEAPAPEEAIEEAPAEAAEAVEAPEETIEEAPTPDAAYAAASAQPPSLSEAQPDDAQGSPSADEPLTGSADEAAPAQPVISEDHPAFQELEARRAAFEEEQRRAEEELRAREEMLRTREELFRSEEEQRNRMIAEEAAKNRYWEEMRAREQARLEEEQRRRMEAEAIARLRYEDELRRRGEERRMQEEARLAEEARRAEEERLMEEQRRAEEEAERERLRLEEEQRLAREEEERRAAEEARLEEERAHADSLDDEKAQQNARIMEMQPFAEERAKYEQMIRDREEQLKAQHARELAEQEMRIRSEDEERFREREQQMIHQNYMSLVNAPPVEEPQGSEYNYFNTPVVPAGEAKTPMYAAKPEAEREYRSLIGKLYSNAIKEDAQQSAPAPQRPQQPPQASKQSAPQPAPAQQTYAPRPAVQPAPQQPAAPAPQKPVQKPAEAPAQPRKAPPAPPPRSLDGIDFYDIEMRAAADGIRITTSGGGTKPVTTTLSVNLVHKGKALFFSALTVFLLCIAEGSLTLGLLRTLLLPRFYPYLIWGAGLAVLLVCGLAYVNHYGERALRRTGNLLVNTIVTYALCVIVILIVALARNIDFSDLGQLMTNVIIPVVFFLNIVVFAVAYYLQVRPKNE